MATIPSIQVLNKLRKDTARLFVDTCTVYREPAAALSDKGQEAEATYPDDWTVVGGQNEACRLVTTERRAVESMTGGQVQSVADGKLMLRFDMPEIFAADRVRITTRSPVATFDLEVVSVRNRTDKLKTS